MQWQSQGSSSDFCFCLSCIYPRHLDLLCLVWKMCSWDQPQISLFPYGFKLCTNPFWSSGIWVVGIRLLEDTICTISDRRYHCNTCRNPMPCINSIPGRTAGKFDFMPIMKQLLKVTIHVGWMLSFHSMLVCIRHHSNWVNRLHPHLYLIHSTFAVHDFPVKCLFALRFHWHETC